MFKGQFGTDGLLENKLLLTFAHLSFFRGLGVPLASVAFTFLHRIWIKTFWADVFQYTTFFVYLGEDISATSDIQVSVRALRRSTYTETDRKIGHITQQQGKRLKVSKEDQNLWTILGSF